MSIVFAHDHKFRKINGKIYSPGGLPNDVFSRYTDVFGEVTVIARIIREKNENPKYSQITNSQVKICEKAVLKEAVAKSDGVIARLPSVIGALAVREARRQKKPYLVEAVGCAWDAYWNYGVKGKLVAPLAFLLMRSQVKKAPFVIYVTNQFLQKRYPTNGKQANCSNVNIQKTDTEVFEKRIGRIKQNVSPIIIGTTAAIDVPYKGQRFVVEALKIEKEKGNTQYEYQMVGGGDGSIIAEYAKEADVEEQVVVLGSMPHEQVLSWLDNIDIYIQPSLQEGLPRALIEAMSRGLPCIGTNAGGTGELLEKQYLINTGKKNLIPANMARTIEIISDPAEMKKQAERNFKEANTYYIDTIINEKRKAIFSEFKSGF